MASATFNLPNQLDAFLRREAKDKLMGKGTLIRQILAEHAKKAMAEKKGARK